MSTLKVRCTHGPAHTKDLLDSRSVVYYLPLTLSFGQRFLCALPLFQHMTGSVGRPMAGYPHQREAAVLRSLDGEGVFEFFHPRLQMLDFALLVFQEQVFNAV
jgi:hypothetical protein